jgi:hypothetical protein
VEGIELQVAFAGHRRAGELGERAALEAKIALCLNLLAAAGVTRARLLTGLAPGADELAAEAWRRAGMGPVHAIFPFLSEGAEGQVGPTGLAQSATWLDGGAARAAGFSPHLAQTRWLLANADLLIVVWSGRAPRGSGGTADAVRLAMEAAMPILWVNPEQDGLKLIRPLPPHHPARLLATGEALRMAGGSIVAAMDAKAIRETLAVEAPAPPGRIEESGLEAWLHGWLWRAFSLFQRIVGGRPTPEPQRAAPADLATQTGYRLITGAYHAADRRASRLAAVHRSEQILLLAAAVLAASLGATPVFWPALKFHALVGELIVGLAALAVWWTAERSRGHEQWTEMRRLAEQLRLNRAGWALGLSTGHAGSPAMRQEHRRLGRPILRQAAPPSGRFDAYRTGAWARWVMDEVVVGQAEYHERQGARNRRIAHRVQLAANTGFAILLVSLAAAALSTLPAASITGFRMPPWLQAAAVAVGVIVPAIGAASMALEARLQFDEQADRSAALARRLRDLAAEVGDEPGLEAAQGAFRDAAEWLLAEADQWREGSGRRRLLLGS